MNLRYKDDFYGWTQEQAAALRAGKLEQIDVENILEEVEAMGRDERNKLVSCLKVLMAHLLKWKYQDGLRGKSWRLTIIEQRKNVVYCIKDSPSLKHDLKEHVDKAYEYAILKAEKETNISHSVFPEQCPWSFEQILDDEFYPES